MTEISNYFQWAGSIMIAISCLHHFHLRPRYIKVLGFYSVSSILFSLAQVAVISLSLNVNNPIGNGFVLSEAWFFSILFYEVMGNVNFKKGIFITTIFYSIFYLISFLFFADQSFSFVRFGRDLIMIGYAIAYFFYLIQKLPEENLLKFPMFWITAAMIFFFSGTFVLSFFRDYIVNILKDDTSGFWAFRNFFRFVFCLVLAYAGWIDWRLMKSKGERI